MRLMTEQELEEMEALLAALLSTEMTDTSRNKPIQKTRSACERFQILKLHSQLIEIYETQTSLRKAEERLQQLITQISQ